MTTRTGLLTFAIPLLAGTLATTATAQESPRYTWLGASYQWTDVNYAVKLDGAQHEGFKVDASVGLIDFGRFGVHVFGEYFDGDFSGTCFVTTESGAPCPPEGQGDLDSKSYVAGAGLSFSLTDTTDLVGKLAYLNSELEDIDDDGWTGELLIRSAISDKVEVEGGYRYSDIGGDSNISNNDILLGLGYHVNEWLTLRARGIVFDDDTGFEIGARVYFGSFLGRDNVIR